MQPKPATAGGDRFDSVVSPQVLDLKPYVPGKPIDELRRERGLARIVKLASNENPLGPSPAALAPWSARPGA